MTQTQTSMRQAHSKLTLAIVLVVFVCQFFASCWSMSVPPPTEHHPLGIDAQHSHSNHTDQHQVNLSQFADAVEAQAQDHHHDSHSHTSCHPPVDLALHSAATPTEAVASPRFSYPSRRYAPPIPPPNA